MSLEIMSMSMTSLTGFDQNSSISILSLQNLKVGLKLWHERWRVTCFLSLNTGLLICFCFPPRLSRILMTSQFVYFLLTNQIQPAFVPLLVVFLQRLWTPHRLLRCWRTQCLKATRSEAKHQQSILDWTTCFLINTNTQVCLWLRTVSASPELHVNRSKCFSNLPQIPFFVWLGLNVLKIHVTLNLPAETSWCLSCFNLCFMSSVYFGFSSLKFKKMQKVLFGPFFLKKAGRNFIEKPFVKACSLICFCSSPFCL